MKKRFLVFILCLFMPILFVGCESLNKDYLSTPTNLTVEADGIINFERVDNDEYYVISINNLEQNVFVANQNPYMELYNKNGVNYLQYDISRMLNLGESYAIKVKACATKKKESAYSPVVSYVHQVHVETPETQITGTTLTWDNVYNASSYMVKVVTPSTVVEADDPETIANASNVFSSVYSLNKFDFSSMLTEAGEFKFYVKAISRDNNYLESGFSHKIVYENHITLATPSGLKLHKFQNDWILTVVVDNLANGLNIELNNQTEQIDMNANYVEHDDSCNNLVYINLNQAFKSKQIDFSKLENAKVSCQSVYTTQSKNYYTSSNWSLVESLSIAENMESPVIEYNSEQNVISWQAIESSQLIGYKVYVCKGTGVETHILDKTTLSYMLPEDFVSAFVQTIGSGAKTSELSNFVFNSNNTSTSLNINLNNNKIEWTLIEDAYYIVETNNGVTITTDTSIDLTAIDYVITSIKVTAIKANTNSNTASQKPNYSIKLETPKNAGFVSSNKYLLSFDKVENAIGYRVYVTDLSQETNQAVCIEKLFSENRADLSNYVTRGKEYRVQVQAVADKFGIYTVSDLSSKDLTLTYNQILDVPQFVVDNLGSPVTISNDGTRRYYLNFNGVEGAYRYEIMVNFNTKTVLHDNRATAYQVDITDFLTDINGEIMANAYNISLRALPQENDTITQASKSNSYAYKLRAQLKQVTNIVVTDPDKTEGKYILSFDLQDNAQNYSVEIIKLNDTEYTSYLASLTPKLTLPITNVKGAIDITAYVQQAGEYYIYMTAHPGADNSYYDPSDRSSTFAVVSKLQTLTTPHELTHINQSKTEFLASWLGDNNADGYVIKVTTPKGKEYIYKTTQTSFNINDVMTVEGNYKFAVKSMVGANSESSKSYISSAYSEDYLFTYRYTELKDFERYGVCLFDDITKYNYAISDVTNLTNLLWYHLLFGVDKNYNLNIYINPNDDETVKQAIIRLASEASNYQLASGSTVIYDFESDTQWNSLLNSASNSSLLGYICRCLLEEYPELALVGNFECEETNANVFSLKFENLLNVEKVENSAHVRIAKDFVNNYKYIDKSLRRNTNSVFAIDTRKEMEVNTTEQLFMAVQYGFKPVFGAGSNIAKQVYENARLVLTAIASNNMTDLEKVTAIFDWLEFAYNINMDAKMITTGAVTKQGEISDWGTRAEFYLEGLLYNIRQALNGDLIVDNTQATSESITKAFVLLCGIEGIDARKINGSLLYKDTEASEITGHDHSWNKVYVANENEANWYNVDLTYSDLRYDVRTKSNSYNMASHLFFLVSDAYLQSNLNFGNSSNALKVNSMNEHQIVTMPTNKQIGKIEANYDYYANTIKTISYEKLQEIVNNIYLVPSEDYMNEGATQAEDAPAQMWLKYMADGNYRQYLFSEYDGRISRLQSFVVNMLIYGKSMIVENSSSLSSFELSIEENSSLDLGSYVVSQLTNLTRDTMNGMYITNEERNAQKYLSISTFSTFDRATNTTKIIVTMQYTN